MGSQVDYCQLPSGVSPDGEYNLVDPESLAPTITGISIFLTVWSTLFIAGRFFVNFRKLSAADWFVLVGFILSVGYTAVVLMMNQYARHIWDTPACWFNARYMKMLYVQGTLLGPTVFFSKCSVLLLYLQLFTIQRPMRWAIYFGLVLTGLTYWPSIPLEAWYAAPHVGESWTDLLTNGMPEHLIYWGVVQGTFAVIVDIYIFCLPFPVLVTLQLSTKKRIGLIAVFVTALTGVIASVVALVFRVGLLSNTDATWANAQLFPCIITENNVAIIVGCMPAFATFMRVHVSETGIFASLTSRFSRTKASTAKSGGSSSTGASGSRPEQKSTGTLGRRDPYHELDEIAHLGSDASAMGYAKASADSVQATHGAGVVRAVDADYDSNSNSWHHGQRY